MSDPLDPVYKAVSDALELGHRQGFIAGWKALQEAAFGIALDDCGDLDTRVRIARAIRALQPPAETERGK